jgi:hypothetical protein
MSEPVIERRRKIFLVDCNDIDDLLVGRVEILTDFPDGMVFVGVQWSLLYNAFMVCYEHDSFEPVPAGCEMPIEELSYRYDPEPDDI